MSKDGRIGMGIYFANQNDARLIANHRGHGTGFAILKCKVNANKCKTGIHPPWAGIANGFQEWCLTNQTNYRITTIYLTDGTIYGNINDP